MRGNKMGKLKLYKIREDYIDFLRKYDSKVLYNKNEKRVYIGVIFPINDTKYFIPLSSPKKKHETMKNTIDFLKINNGEDGAINFNNMIPIIDDVVVEFDILDEKRIRYKNILFNQVKFIKRESKNILENAIKLYEKVTKYNSYISKRCVNFKLLEMVANNYQTYQEVAMTVDEDIEPKGIKENVEVEKTKI
ncbi:type III toxin-antitoxin system ToxN/AbiQ family toxin [Clostridium botulinum]|uniref:Type III toxin-antitoxin system ToxN/AbiQ family toxin n=2 Tax=Clostridium botulinum TaxID=1491 RepID=A0A6B4JJB6_CLOBO|nr:type III toxin-antitoxin system ToxN/AbiQ family toxin [Clostridium botulinum]NFL51481.1 type III toxin-antitoxin system ToxN/AbiQ family toxin [Clostridium botulinum]NFS13373.1 type III toxin-antitoxin system ToxN/AbiQ family toxin [Clostridium botulinum]NFV24661.1 type III toxin-antitoxin system ToxN/AbiQ family toxin [Clostridium botulinum]